MLTLDLLLAAARRDGRLGQRVGKAGVDATNLVEAYLAETPRRRQRSGCGVRPRPLHFNQRHPKATLKIKVTAFDGV
jgi:hypothetical protein